MRSAGSSTIQDLADHLGLDKSTVSLALRGSRRISENTQRRVVQARRLLPGAVRRDMEQVAEAQHLAGNPRIARQLDRARISQAGARAEAHLRRIDRAALRRDRVLGLAGTVALNLLAAAALLLALLWLLGAI